MQSPPGHGQFHSSHHPPEFSLSMYSKYGLSKRLSVNIFPVKLLNEANPSVF